MESKDPGFFSWLTKIWGSGEYFGTLPERWLTCGRRNGVQSFFFQQYRAERFFQCSRERFFSAPKKNSSNEETGHLKLKKECPMLNVHFLAWWAVITQQTTSYGDIVWNLGLKLRAPELHRFRLEILTSLMWEMWLSGSQWLVLTGDLSMLAELHEKGTWESFLFRCAKLIFFFSRLSKIRISKEPHNQSYFV